MQNTDLHTYQVFFTLMGRILHQFPSRELFAVLVEDGAFDELPLELDDASFRRGAALLHDWSKKMDSVLTDEAYHELVADNTLLFAGHQEMVCPPWESFYFNTERQIFQRQTLEVRNWYRDYGLQITKLNSEPDDHIGLELEFVAILLKQALEAEGSQRDFLLSATKNFIQEHPASWIHLWTKGVSQTARTDFYQGIALILPSALKKLESYL